MEADLLERLSRRLSEVDLVLVEGARDERALHELFPSLNVMRINRGVSLVTLAEEVARSYSRVLVLTDFDRRGEAIGKRISGLLRSMGVEVDNALRSAFGSLGLMHVEELPSLIEKIGGQ